MRRILVIESEVPIIRLLSTALPQHGFEAVSVTTAAEGITKVAEVEPVLVVLASFPEDGGASTVARTLRLKHEQPILLLASGGEEEEISAALDAGADDFLLKPSGCLS